MENLIFELRPNGPSRVDELCLLGELEPSKEIKSWQFGRHTDLARTSIMVGFLEVHDGDRQRGLELAAAPEVRS